jgi:hypothetical protein
VQVRPASDTHVVDLCYAMERHWRVGKQLHQMCLCGSGSPVPAAACR